MTALLLVPGVVLGAFVMLYGTTLLDRITPLPATDLVPPPLPDRAVAVATTADRTSPPV